MATCRGIDVSAYQGTQDWAARKAEGVVFAFAKASEGQTSRDPKFAAHMRGIIAAGLVHGAYHFAWPTQDPVREADNYIAAVKEFARKGFCHWLDLERYSDGRNYAGKSSAQIAVWVTTWLARVRNAFPGQRVGVYTSADDIAKGHVPLGVPLWYPAYPWGPAAYSRAEAAAQPKPSGRAPLIWQFTSQPIDRNICYLSAADLRAWAAGTTQEDDVALTTDDKTWITKAIADGIDAHAFKAVVQKDAITAPADAPDVATNPTWRLDSYEKDTNTRVRSLEKQIAGLTAANSKLVDTVATLAANIGDLDPAAIVTELKTELEALHFHLDVTP
jgi:GH25 family lysozyme M1 (1,4-beta-N-acetylmuramidase)